MSVQYVAIQWNRHKRIYDACIAVGVTVYLALFVFFGKLVFRGTEAISDPILLMRASGSCAYVMLHVIMSIGPMARIDRRFAPLLYNRRHLGVAMFLVAALHGFLVLGFYHGFGVWNPLKSLLISNTNYTSLRAFPFQILGAASLAIFFVMASTSHDFWNRNLGTRGWKVIHMAIYPGYAVLVMHVALGALQTQRGVALPIMLAVGAGLVIFLHVYAGLRETWRDRHKSATVSVEGRDWIDVCAVEALSDDRAMVVAIDDHERVALFSYGGCVSAVSNVCAHQGGPLGEGKIIDGCITCPWHGWQYRPEDGCSPPPFTERIPAYRLRVHAQRILLDPTPIPAGSQVSPARIEVHAS